MRKISLLLFLTLTAQLASAKVSPLRLKCGYQAQPGKSPLSAQLVMTAAGVQAKFVVDQKSPEAPNQLELDLDQVVVSLRAQNDGQVSKYGYIAFQGFAETSKFHQTFREVELSLLQTELAKTTNIRIGFGISGELYSKDSRGSSIYNYGMICRKTNEPTRAIKESL